jgi:AcrR family transcriptional regulator
MVEENRDRSTRDALIAATARHLWSGDESELRILDICQETGLSTSVIYGHFRSRQGLIDATLLQMLCEVTDGLVLDIERLVDGPHPTGRLLDTLQLYLSDPDLHDERTRNRQTFLRVVATTLARPVLQPGFLEIYRDYIARSSDLYDEALRRGLLSERLTGRQWAVLLEGQMLTRAIHNLDGDWDDLDVSISTISRLLEDSSDERPPGLVD